MFLPCRVVSAVDCSASKDLLSQQEPREAVLTHTHLDKHLKTMMYSLHNLVPRVLMLTQ